MALLAGRKVSLSFVLFGYRWVLIGMLIVFILGDTKVLAAVYGPKPGTRKNENPEKACFEDIWKPKSGQIGIINCI